MGGERNFDCARSNEIQKIPKTAPRTSLTMRINFNKGQGLSSKPQSIQENIFLFVDEICFEGLQLSFFLPPQQTPPYLHQKVIPHRNVWFSSCLSAEYCLGVPEVDPNKKPRKNFFVKNDHAQYGKEFLMTTKHLLSRQILRASYSSFKYFFLSNLSINSIFNIIFLLF